MVDPLHSAAAADDCLADDVLFFHPGDIPFLDPLEGLGEVEEVGDEEEGEELEWVSNKDAIPMLDSPFDYTGFSGGGGRGGAQVAAASGAPPRGPRSKRPRRSRSVVEPVLRPEEAAAERRKRSTARGGSEWRRCLHCAAEETPQWRAGPDGPKTLCNACGVRYKSGRLLPEYRPAASPTFSPALHSNSHRRVLEMRRRGIRGAAALTAD